MANKREKIFNLTDGKCIYCGCDLDIDNFHIDHLIPKSNGGKDKGNMFPACPDCNLSKGDLSIEDFRQKIRLMCNGTHVGRMMTKYFQLEPETQIRFYFEVMDLDEETQNGNLQKHIYNILDGQ